MQRHFCVWMIVSALAWGSSALSSAALLDRGGGLIYDDVLNVTWLQDANYLATAGLHPTGEVSWFDAMAFADALEYVDTVRDVTWDDWRLPSAFDRGANVVCTNQACTDSEFGHLQFVDGFSAFVNVPDMVTHWTSTDVPDSTFPGGLAYVYSHAHGDHYQTSKDPFYKPTAWFLRDGDVGVAVPEPNWVVLIGFAFAVCRFSRTRLVAPSRAALTLRDFP
jgi:hypothetical protein